MIGYAVCGRLCERKWLRRIIANTRASIISRSSSPTPRPIDVPTRAHTVDRSVAAELGAGAVLPVRVGDADEPGDAVFDALGCDVPVPLADGELVGLGDEPVDALGDDVIDDGGVSDALRVVDGDSDGLDVIDGDGVIDGEAPTVAVLDGDGVMLGV
jgi:hypothetical protein